MMGEPSQSAKCLLCGGLLPSYDYEAQVEHMRVRHGASSEKEARNLVFTKILQG